MAYLDEISKWEEGIYKYTEDDWLEGGEDGIDNIPTGQLANRTLYLKEAINSIPEALKPPIELNLESMLPEISTLTSKDVGRFYIIQNMDITAPNKTGKAWLNYLDGDSNNPLVWYKVFDQYFGADGTSIILTGNEKLSINTTWLNDYLNTKYPNILTDITDLKNNKLNKTNEPEKVYGTDELGNQKLYNKNEMGGGGGLEDVPAPVLGEWTAHSLPAIKQWRSITYGNGLFVAVALDVGTNSVATSPDGINWTMRNVSYDVLVNLRFITYGNGLFVALNGTSANRIMTSPDGINWTFRQIGIEANAWQSIIYGNGLFVAVSSDGINRIMTSPDGINWTMRTAPEQSSFTSITYGNGLFVAVSSNGNVIILPDGINWTIQTPAEQNYWQSVCYGNGLFVAIAQSGTNRVMTSPDGITWTIRAAPKQSWMSVCYGNGLFVVVSYAMSNNEGVTTSPDGINWTEKQSAEQNYWQSIIYGNGLFVAVSSDGINRVMTAEWSPPLHVRRRGEWVEASQTVITLANNPASFDLPKIGEDTVESRIQELRDNMRAVISPNLASTLIFTVPITELRATILALPRIMGRSVTINVLPGSTTDVITVERFFGSGSITIRAVDISGTPISTVGNTHNVDSFIVQYINCSNIHIQGFRATRTGAESVSFYLAWINNAITLQFCSAITSYYTDSRGIATLYVPLLIVRGGQFSNKHYAILAFGLSRILVMVTEVVSGSGNVNVFTATDGGMIALADDTVNTITGTTRYLRMYGGIITDGIVFRP